MLLLAVVAAKTTVSHSGDDLLASKRHRKVELLLRNGNDLLASKRHRKDELLPRRREGFGMAVGLVKMNSVSAVNSETALGESESKTAMVGSRSALIDSKSKTALIESKTAPIDCRKIFVKCVPGL